MEFRTKINIPVSDVKINHSAVTMLFGSCFSTHIGSKLQQHKFHVDVNPFGIYITPSISVLRRLSQRRDFTEQDLLTVKGCTILQHHGQFSSPDKNKCLETINNRFMKAADTLLETDFLLVTFGTAYVYWQIDSGEIAANCHKFPDSEFHRARLTVGNIVEEWSDLIEQLIETRPNLKLLFTVSPVRHWKDGAHENQLSKSILHLAIDELQMRYSGHVLYFPAYELMMDELRDYRFYGEDMLHPSSVAVDYIWERFAKVYFSDATRINSE